ncbi:hypothetical protein DBR10_09435 [Caulobacter sp. HMWF025]|nr:hypothetical protein DBR10_09435 [Caulobacter sp. HMWF025]
MLGGLQAGDGGVVFGDFASLLGRHDIVGGDQVLHIGKGGFDLFASLGHGTKIRNQRARLISSPEKVTSA